MKYKENCNVFEKNRIENDFNLQFVASFGNDLVQDFVLPFLVDSYIFWCRKQVSILVCFVLTIFNEKHIELN